MYIPINGVCMYVSKTVFRKFSCLYDTQAPPALPLEEFDFPYEDNDSEYDEKGAKKEKYDVHNSNTYIHIHTYIHTYIHSYIHTYMLFNCVFTVLTEPIARKDLSSPSKEERRREAGMPHTTIHSYIHTYIHINIHTCPFSYKNIEMIRYILTPFRFFKASKDREDWWKVRLGYCPKRRMEIDLE